MGVIDEVRAWLTTAPGGLQWLRVVVKDYLPSQEGLTGPGKFTSVEVTNNSWTPIPTTGLNDRSVIAMQNNTDYEMRIRWDNLGDYENNGMLLRAGDERFYDIKLGSIPYVRAEPNAMSTLNLDVEEIAHVST